MQQVAFIFLTHIYAREKKMIPDTFVILFF